MFRLLKQLWKKTPDVEYQPLTSLREGAPVEFYIPASTEEYLDLHNTKLHATFDIIKSGGGPCVAADEVGPINDIFNGLWDNVELFLNDRLVSHSTNTHGYTSILSHYIHDSEESLHSERSMRLIYKDTAAQLDATNAKTPNAVEAIQGFDLKEDGSVSLIQMLEITAFIVVIYTLVSART